MAADTERLARFRREAQVLASLNHASIAAIHGLEESAGTPFLVRCRGRAIRHRLTHRLWSPLVEISRRRHLRFRRRLLARRATAPAAGVPVGGLC